MSNPMRSLDDLCGMMESMHGIVNLDAAAALLQGLLQHISRQDNVMHQLQSQLQLMIPRREHEEIIHHLEEKIIQLQEDVNKAQKAATATLLDQEYTAGELATSNYYQLQKLSKHVSACITRAEVEQQYQELMLIHDENLRIQHDLQQIHNIINELNIAQTQLNETMAEQERRIGLKLDRSELPHLQALANKIVTYDDFRIDAINRIILLETDTKATQIKAEQHAQELTQIQHTLEHTVLYNMNKLALKKDVHILAKELQIQQEVLQRVAFQSSIEELRRSLGKTLHVMEQTQHRIEATKVDLLDLKGVVSTKAWQSEVDLCVKKTDFTLAITTTNQEIATKTDIPYVEAIQEHVQLLEQRLQEESERVAVALRFVDWFTTRGENYEHNLKIIDRHLKDLVTSDKTPRVHSYYLPGNRVQFNTATSAHDPNVIPIGELPLSSEKVLKALQGPDVLQLNNAVAASPPRATRQVSPFTSPTF